MCSFFFVIDNSLLEEKDGEKGETEDGNVKVTSLVRHFVVYIFLYNLCLLFLLNLPQFVVT